MLNFDEHNWDGKILDALDVSGMTLSQWLAARQEIGGLGGSEIGVAMGLDGIYKSPVRLFYEKVGLVVPHQEDNIFAFMGRVLEDIIVQLWKHWDGDPASMMRNFSEQVKVKDAVSVKAILCDRSIPGIFANIDSKITSHPMYDTCGVLEIKTMSGYAYDMWETGLPPKYIAQTQSYMLITGAKYAEIFVLRDGRNFDSYLFEPSEAIQENIIEVAADFKSRVDKGREIMLLVADEDKRLQFLAQLAPAPDYGHDYADFMSELYRDRLDKVEVIASKEVWEGVKEIESIKNKIKTAESRIGYLKNKVIEEMVANGTYFLKSPDNDGYVANRKRLTYKIR